MLNAHNIHHVVEVCNGILNGCFSFFLQESIVQGNLCYTTFLGQCLHLFIGQVAWMIAERTGRGVRSHNRFRTDVERIVEGLDTGMRDVYYHAYPVHFMDDLFAESVYAQVLFIVPTRTAELVVSIMAESQIDDASFAETFYVGNVLADCITVFNTEHNGFLSFSLQAVKVGRSVSDIYMILTLCYHGFDFIQDAVGLGSSSQQVFVGQSLLFQVGYHDRSIQAAFRHLVQVYQYLWIPTGKVDVLVEEHRGIAMRIEGQDAVMQLLGFHEGSGFQY